MLILGLAMAVLASDPDGIVTTGRATPLVLDATAAAPIAPSVDPTTAQEAAHGLTTDEQIERWIAAREPEAKPFAHDVGVKADDREMHGYVEAGIGTGGYRSYGGGVSLPLGEEGRLDLRYRQVEGEGVYRYGYPGYGYGGSPFDRSYGGFDALGRSTSFGVRARWDGDERRTRQSDTD